MRWRGLAGMAGFITLLHLLGWGTLVLVVAPAHYALGTGVFGVGLGVTVYVLGMRHAFDADHIAAIDNTTRKLMADGRRPVTVGFWFALGHSSVVFGMCLALSLGVRSIGGRLTEAAGLFGTVVSGTFLLLLGLINLVALRGIVRVFRRMRGGGFDEAALEAQLAGRGLLSRLLGRVLRAVTRPWQMYPIGFLFGLGFDTATEVSLLVLAGGAALAQLPWYAILVLPVLFAAGMTLFDALDGCFMTYAYGWAFARPVRKVYYNMTITGLSVAVALVIGGVELAGLLGGFEVPLDYAGYAIVALFALTWAGSVAVWRFGRIEEKWGYSSNLPR